ncbi:kinase-like protein [Polychaeton citri CBS 116435]|uniref:Kinase-like protein n=1 Tax=Polychaeton citri CBS 116435 TaxID=1314669 RepID=A0A9P4USP6_9PEZI|nr:kinase-like protein [Polychaeton citri CBS 116435]
MSKFFRSSADSDSESSSADSSSEDGSEHAGINSASKDDSSGSLRSLVDGGSTTSGVLAITGSATPAVQPRDMLLHALLEERCQTEARNELDRSHLDSNDPAIHALARRKYKQIASQLAPYGLVAAGLESDVHEATRQRYRDGLNILSRTSNAAAIPGHDSQVTVPAPTRRLLTGATSDAAVANGFLSGLQGVHISPALSSVPPSLASAFPAHPSLNGNRYGQEFDELGVIGKGGYGIVYHVQHKLDGTAYAIKKVPLSSSRLQKINLRGQKEVDDLLMELRTLAKLDHPNIVRYFSGWIEWTTFGNPSSSFGSDTRPNFLERQCVQTVEDSQSSWLIGRVETTSASDDANILFENSAPHSDKSTGSLVSSQHVPLVRTRTRSSTGTASDSIETISRDAEFAQSESLFMPSNTNDAPFPTNGEPTLALHMQMALYPMTLAEFLTSSYVQAYHQISPLTHCFHIEPSVRIMLAILDGVEYLHSEGVVHRDLKPGNIFLGPNQNPRNTRGSVDLMLCDDCREQGAANPISLNVRIGDFGLVTEIANPEAGDSTSTYDAVGTEVYRPQKALSASIGMEKLDTFALGIVLFELIWKFETRMERLETLRALKQGQFPTDFFTSGKVDVIASCIMDMILMRTGDSATINGIRHRLSCLV